MVSGLIPYYIICIVDMPKPMNRTGMRDVFLQDFQGTGASAFTPANSLAGNIRAISAYPKRTLRP